MTHKVVFSRAAQRDARKLKKSHLKKQALDLIDLLKRDPYQTPPRVEKLSGDLKGCFSRRINIQHRLVYEVFEDQKIVHVLRMWSHYE